MVYTVVFLRSIVFSWSYNPPHPPVFKFNSLHNPHLMVPCPPSSKLYLTPRPFPSHSHSLHLCSRSSQCQGRGAEWLAGSCTRPGCTGWSTGPAEGVEPGDSMQLVPGQAEGWPRGSPPPAEPHSRRQSAGLSSRGLSREGGPEETREDSSGNDMAAGCCRGKFFIQPFYNNFYLTRIDLEKNIFS